MKFWLCSRMFKFCIGVILVLCEFQAAESNIVTQIVDGVSKELALLQIEERKRLEK